MTESSDLLKALLATGNNGIRKEPGKATLTSSLEATADGQLKVELNAEAGAVNGETVDAYLVANGYPPEEWQVKTMRRSEWTMPGGGTGESVRYAFERVAANQVPFDVDAIDWTMAQDPHVHVSDGDYGFVLAIGDLQIGKSDGDGIEGTVARAIEYIDRAATALLWYREAGYGIGTAHIAWLGDHIEGFESQGGKNSHRTPLGLTDQVRIMRRIMLHAAVAFAPLVDKLTMAAVPGNHGRITTGNGGNTRADDNWDTDCLVAVGDALLMNPDAFGHVEIYVPGIDEVHVTLDVAGTTISHVHGHQWTPGKHFDWWQGQQFGGALVGVDVLLAGHLHHFLLDTWGKLMFLQVPALEDESAWYRQRKGVPGNPGVVVALTLDGRVSPIEVIS